MVLDMDKERNLKKLVGTQGIIIVIFFGLKITELKFT